MMSPSKPEQPSDISVVVPVLNGEDTIGDCLAALAVQTIDAHRYEVIVVDDGSTDRSAHMASQHAATVVQQSHAGAASARNLGVLRSVGTVLLFTDADCEPCPNWIEEMLAPFSDPAVAGVKGVYRTRQRSLVARFAQAEYEEKYSRLARPDQIDFVDTYAAAYRRDVFLAHQGFDPKFLLDEDQEFSYRLASAGRRLIFAPSAAVYHLHPATVREYASRKLRLARWKVAVHIRYPAKALRDSYTPWTQRAQLVLLPLTLALLVGSAVGQVSWVFAALAAALAGASLVPLMVKAARQGPWVAVATPPLAFIRATASAIGLMSGFLDHFVARQRLEPEP